MATTPPKAKQPPAMVLPEISGVQCGSNLHSTIARDSHNKKQHPTHSDNERNPWMGEFLYFISSARSSNGTNVTQHHFDCSLGQFTFQIALLFSAARRTSDRICAPFCWIKNFHPRKLHEGILLQCSMFPHLLTILCQPKMI